MDISTTLLALAGFVARFNDPVMYRIKIKYCALCDSVCARTDTLSFRKDAADRHNILDTIMDWIQDPAPVHLLDSRSIYRSLTAFIHPIAVRYGISPCPSRFEPCVSSDCSEAS
jgi:neurofibromin 1